MKDLGFEIRNGFEGKEYVNARVRKILHRPLKQVSGKVNLTIPGVDFGRLER